MALFYGFAPKAARKHFCHTIRELEREQKIVAGKEEQWIHHLEDLTMNAHKHMEAIFGVVLALGCVVAALPERAGTAAAPQAASGAMPVVVIKARRMTEMEKRQSLEVQSGQRSAAAGT
jgi:hypothetical protein